MNSEKLIPVKTGFAECKSENNYGDDAGGGLRRQNNGIFDKKTKAAAMQNPFQRKCKFLCGFV